MTMQSSVDDYGDDSVSRSNDDYDDDVSKTKDVDGGKCGSKEGNDGNSRSKGDDENG